MSSALIIIEDRGKNGREVNGSKRLHNLLPIFATRRFELCLDACGRPVVRPVGAPNLEPGSLLFPPEGSSPPARPAPEGLLIEVNDVAA